MKKGRADARCKRTDALQRRRQARACKARKKAVARNKRKREKDGADFAPETTSSFGVDMRPAKSALTVSGLWTCACGREYPAHHRWEYWRSQKNYQMWHCAFCHDVWLHGISAS